MRTSEAGFGFFALCSAVKRCAHTTRAHPSLFQEMANYVRQASFAGSVLRCAVCCFAHTLLLGNPQLTRVGKGHGTWAWDRDLRRRLYDEGDEADAAADVATAND